jgi:hypothetical protein
MSRLETGNAAIAGQDFRGWFVGDLQAWARKNGLISADADSPRNSNDIQVKWFAHPAGDRRKATAPPDRFITLGVLISGNMLTEFTDSDGETTTVSQSTPGDFVIWHGPSYSHSWKTPTGATVLTVRWPVASDVISNLPERLVNDL